MRSSNSALGRMPGVMFLILSAGGAVFAHSEEQTGLQEVVVTAQKREENLQGVPISISAISSAQLQTRGLSSFKDIALTTPSITTAPAYGATGTLLLYMRGMGTSDPDNIASESGVGIYEDGFYIPRSDALTFDMADLERVEVLRGPQGTLYGFNTAGGAVNLISRKPTGEFGLRQTLDYGNRNMFRSLTVLDLPVWHNIATKFTFLKSGIDGFVRNQGSSHDFGENNQTGGKFQLHWEAGAKFQADYFAELGRQRATPQQYFQNASFDGQTITLYDPDTLQPGTPYLYSGADRPRETTYRPIDLPLSSSRVAAHGLTLTWNVNDALTLKSLTGYRDSATKRRNDFAEAFSTGPFPLSDHEFGSRDSRAFSQEVQAIGELSGSSLSYVAGAYYFRERGMAVEGATGQVPDLVPIYGSFAFYAIHDEYAVRSRSKAVYGQLTWRPDFFAQRTEFTLGGRYTRDFREGGGTNLVTGAIAAPSSATFAKFTPTGTASLKLTDDVSTYAKVATGYRAGGVCLRGVNCFRSKFDPETLTSYELGLKSYWFDRRMRLNAAAFNSKFKDMQLNFTNGVIGQGTIQGIFNAGSAAIRGIELDLQASPVESLSVTASYSYLDASIDRIDVPPDSTFDAARNPASPYNVGDNAKDAFVIPFSPKHSVDLGADYTMLQRDDNSVTLHLDYQYRGESYQLPTYGPAAPGRNFGQVPSYGLFNGRLTLATMLPRGDRFSVSLWGKNLFDKEHIISVLGNGNNLTGFSSSAAAWAPPRSYGISFAYEYGDL